LSSAEICSKFEQNSHNLTIVNKKDKLLNRQQSEKRGDLIMSDDFDFRDDKEKEGVEASLDDFFQTTEEELATQAPEAELPVDKDKAEGLISEPEIKLTEEEKPKEKKKEKKRKKEKKAKAPKEPKEAKGILVYLIIGLVVLILAGGGYFAYLKFFSAPKPPKVVKKLPTPSVKKPKPKAPAPKTPAQPQQPGPSSKKPLPLAKQEAKPEIPKLAQPSVPKPSKPLQNVAQKITPTPIKPAIKKGWSCQIGAYMLKESMEGPENKLRSLGFNNFYYVDTKRTLLIYHLYLRGSYSQAEAEQKKQALERLGYKPRLEPKGDKYRVKVYSYGSKSIAFKAKSKLERAGIGKGEVIARREKVVLHQLRVGPYSTKSEAKKVLARLKSAGFKPLLVEEK